MFHMYNILFFILFLGYTFSNDIEKYYPNREMVSSRSIYELVQVRRAAARFAALRNRTHRYNNTSNLYRIANKFLNKNTHIPAREITDYKTSHQQFVLERLKIVIIISCIAVFFMIILVLSCILIRYYRDKNPEPTQRQQSKQKRTYQATKFSQVKNDKRNFSRKPRTLPTAV